MSSKLDSGFSRVLPFHSLPNSSIIKGTASVEEALVLAGLSWDVEKAPAGHMVDGVFEEVPGKFVTRRKDNQDPLGIVGAQYSIFQNHESFCFADSLLDNGARFEAAGSWDGGSKVFLVAALPDSVKVQDEEDIRLFLTMVNSHDGSAAVSWFCSPIRLACINQMRLAVSKAVSSSKLRHTRGINDRIQLAAETLGLVDIYRRDLQDGIAQLQSIEMELQEVESFFETLTTSDRVRTSLLTTYNTSPTIVPGTAWSTINAVSEAIQHNPARVTGVETRFDSHLDGSGQRVIERATRLLLNR